MSRQPYKLPIENLPLFVDSDVNGDGDDTRSYVSFSRGYDTGGRPTNTELDNSEFLVLANPIMHINAPAEESVFNIVHPWANDAEGDCARIAVVKLDSMVFKSAHYNVHRFTGYITSMSFYNPFETNVLTDAVKLDATEEPWANNGYPFTPPSFEFEKVSLPLKVDISIVYGGAHTLNELRTRPTPRTVK